jgi:hypothetical protein
MKPRKKDPNRYPPGWNRERVEALIAHYERQTPDEEAAEIEASFQAKECMFSVPRELVPAVQELLAGYGRTKKQSAGRRSAKHPKAARRVRAGR